MLRWCEFAVAGLLTLLVLFSHIRFCQSAGPLWRDEVCSFHVATIPTLKRGWDLLAFENQPVVHYLVLRGWCALGFGATDLGLRVLGLIISFLLVSALWISGWIFNRSAPLLPLALFALNKYTLRADSLRPHGLALVWITLAFAFIWQLTFQPRRTRTVILATTAAVLSVQTVFLNAFLLGAICAGSIAVLAVKKAWQTAAWIFGIGFIAALSLLPYVPMIIKAQQWNSIRAADHTVGYIARLFVWTLTTNNPIAGGVCLVLVAASLAAIVVLCLGRGGTGRAGEAGGHFLFAAMASVSAIVWTIGFLWVLKFPMQDRYFLPPIAVMALSGGVLAAALRSWIVARLATLLASVSLAAAFCHSSFDYTKMRLTNCDVAAAAVAEIAEPNDAIILTRFAYGITFQRYYRGSVAWHGIPDISDYSLFRWDLVKDSMMQPDPMHEVLVRVEVALRSGHRVFLVGQWEPFPTAQPRPLAPAPLTRYGWKLESYLTNWREQVTYFIGQHARDGRDVPLPEKEQVSPAEKLSLYVASGWH